MSMDKWAKLIWATAKSVGATEAVAAALCGNAQQESSLNPNCEEAATGLFQYEHGDPDYNNFVKYCHKHNKKIHDGVAQIKYLLVDGGGFGSSKYKGKGYAHYLFATHPRNGVIGSYPNGAEYGWKPKISWANYLKITDIAKAVKIWSRVYEAPSLPRLDNRIKYAKAWYKKFTGKSFKGVGGGGTVTLTGGKAVVEWAKQWLKEEGNKSSYYIYGASPVHLDGQCDCSGFVGAVFHHFFPKDLSGCSKDGGPHGWSTREFASTNKFKKINVKDAQPGDILNVAAQHIILYVSKTEGYHCTTPEGKGAGGGIKKATGSYYQNALNTYTCLRYRNIDKAKLTVEGEAGAEEGSEGGGLVVSPEKLYSSDNYQYAQMKDTKEKPLTALMQAIVDWMKERYGNKRISQQIEETTSESANKQSTGAAITKVVSDVILSFSSVKNQLNQVVPKYEHRKRGAPKGSKLPLLDSLVEAPFVEVKIGNKILGTYSKGIYPNYIQGLNVEKTNGAVHRYTVQLVHQISPGDNPNYIDQLLSSVGYDIIQIKYGDGATSRYYVDNTAMIVDVTQNFDFVNCNITYTITATSLATSLAVNKKNYSATTSKPSTVIYDLLNTSDFSSAFPAMKNKTEVARKGLIPTDDAVVNIGAMTNATPVAYLSRLVELMRNPTDSNILYALVFSDSSEGAGFEIKQVSKSNKTTAQSFVYDVDVNYPENGDIFNFSIDTNYAWALSYNSSATPEMYDYEIDDRGSIVGSKVKSYYTDTDDKVAQESLWTQLTEYPITGTLTTRGLLSESLLMQYIRINSFVFGIKRSTSGLYIVTKQTDVLNKDGFKTQLSVMRVAGDDEYIDIDARRIT